MERVKLIIDTELSVLTADFLRERPRKVNEIKLDNGLDLNLRKRDAKITLEESK